MIKSLQAHQVVSTEFKGTFADGIAVNAANPEMFKILDSLVDHTLFPVKMKLQWTCFVLLK